MRTFCLKSNGERSVIAEAIQFDSASLIGPWEDRSRPIQASSWLAAKAFGFELTELQKLLLARQGA